MVTREQHGVKKGGQMINGRVQYRKDIQERKEADQGGNRTRKVHDRERVCMKWRRLDREGTSGPGRSSRRVQEREGI